MPMRRRTYLKRGAAIGSGSVLFSVAGCTRGDPPNREDESEDVGSVSLPNPEVVLTEIPDVELDSVDKTDGEYTGTIVNRGGAGRALVNMYWTETKLTPDSDVSQEDLTFVEQKQTVLGADEGAEVSFDKTMPDTYNDVWMIVSAGSVTTTLKNTGESGEVLVMLYEEGDKQTEKTVTIGGGEKTEVILQKDIVRQDSKLSVRVGVPSQ